MAEETSITISSAVWNDLDTSETLSDDDSLVLTFSSDTNRPGGTSALPKTQVDSMFSFENPIGANYTGQWTQLDEFTITVVDSTGNGAASVGDNVLPNSDGETFVRELDTTPAGGTAFSNPKGITTNSTNHIFVSDTDSDIVQIFHPNGTTTGTNLDTTGGTAISNPTRVATNSTNHIFVSDTDSDIVQIFHPNGTTTGTNLDTTGGTAFATPQGITTNSTDYIFVADAGIDLVQIFYPNGTATGTNLDTTGGTAFSNPKGITTNSTDYIFVADAGIDLVQIFHPNGTTTGTNLDTAGGTAFSNPQDVATNSTGYIFVADNTADIVQIFHPNGTATGTNLDTAGGTAITDPRSVAISSDDLVYVTDATIDKTQVFGITKILNTAETSAAFSNVVSTTGDFGSTTHNITLADTMTVSDSVTPTAQDFSSITISSAVWNDLDTSETLSDDDSLVLTFSSDTNRPGGTSALPKTQVDSMFSFENPIGANYTGQWTQLDEFTITVVDSTGNGAASVGDNVLPNSDGETFVRELDTTPAGGTAFVSTRGIATNSTGYIFVADNTADIVQIFHPNGTATGTNLDTTGGTAFANPTHLATNSTDYIFVADTDTNRVQIFYPNGTTTNTRLDTTTGGTAFSTPQGITTNSTDHIFVADAGIDLVQIFYPNGTATGTNLDTTGGTAFAATQGITTNSTGYIFVADKSPDIVQIFHPNGTTTGTNLDTTGGTAFSNTLDVATNSTGYIFVADNTADIVQIFHPNGTATGTNLDTTGGTAFTDPRSVAISSDDLVYVTDATIDKTQIFGITKILNTAETSAAFSNVVSTTVAPFVKFTADRINLDEIILTFSSSGIQSDNISPDAFTISVGSISSWVISSTNEITVTTTGINSTNSVPTVTYFTSGSNTNLRDGFDTVVYDGTFAVATDSVPDAINELTLASSDLVGNYTELIDVLIINSTSYALNSVTIPSNVTMPTMDFTRIISDIDTLNMDTNMTVNALNTDIPVVAEIPAGTVSGSGWTGILTMPQSRSLDSISIDGISNSFVMEFGDPDVSLTFSTPVKFTFTGESGNRAFVTEGSNVGEILSVCDTVDPNTVTTMPVTYPQACKFDSGNDLIIITKIASVFSTGTSSTGGGGGTDLIYSPSLLKSFDVSVVSPTNTFEAPLLLFDDVKSNFLPNSLLIPKEHVIQLTPTITHPLFTPEIKRMSVYISPYSDPDILSYGAHYVIYDKFGNFAKDGCSQSYVDPQEYSDDNLFYCSPTGIFGNLTTFVTKNNNNNGIDFESLQIYLVQQLDHDAHKNYYAHIEIIDDNGNIIKKLDEHIFEILFEDDGHLETGEEERQSDSVAKSEINTRLDDVEIIDDVQIPAPDLPSDPDLYSPSSDLTAYGLSLKKQLQNGVPAENIECKQDLILVLRPNGNLACVTEPTAIHLDWKPFA